MTGLSAQALALSAYLGWHYLAHGPVLGCGGGSACDQVLRSRWSAIGGLLPVSGLAAGVYLAMLIASLFIGPATETSVRRLAWRALLVLAGAIAGSALWFSIVQKWIMGTFCPYCMATHIIGLLLTALVIWQATKQLESRAEEIALTQTAVASPAPLALIGRGSAIGFVIAGMGLAGLLAICQASIPPPPEYRSGESKENHGVIDPRAVPLVGSPDAACVVTLLFDYKCPHCQQLHLMLEETVRRYAGRVTFALCPTPLNTKCNPYIPRDVDEFKDSCELAKIALAVWVANHEAFPVFNRWMFSFEAGDRWQPRSLAAAKAKAVALVGRTKLDAALADPWIGRHLQTSIQLYGNTIQGGNTAVPKLVFGARWVIPEPNDAEDLVSIIHNRLAVPVAEPSPNR